VTIGRPSRRSMWRLRERDDVTDVDVDQLARGYGERSKRYANGSKRYASGMPMAYPWHDSDMTLAERSEILRSKDLRTEDLIISVSVSQYCNIEVRYLTISISASQYRYILIPSNITSISARYQSRTRSSLDQVTISLITVEATTRSQIREVQVPCPREDPPDTP
jgi:hypothetical protein